MIAALMLDLDDSVDFPGNTATALGRPLCAYPFMAARATGTVHRYFVVTSSPPVKGVALQNGAEIVDPPAEGQPRDAEALLRRGFKVMLEHLKTDNETLDLLVLFFANAPALTGGLLGQGLEALETRPDLDSAVSVSPFNRWKPSNARRETARGLLEPYVAAAVDLGADALFPDWGVQVLRPRSLEKAFEGPAPFTWLAGNVLPLKQWGGGPIDYQWQLPSLEYWLQKHGYSDLSGSMQPQPKLQPQTQAKKRPTL